MASEDAQYQELQQVRKDLLDQILKARSEQTDVKATISKAQNLLDDIKPNQHHSVKLIDAIADLHLLLAAGYKKVGNEVGCRQHVAQRNLIKRLHKRGDTSWYDQ